jgi:hypothetical protein
VAELKGNGLINIKKNLIKEISRHPKIQAAIKILLTAFGQTYSEIWKQNEVQRDLKFCQ